jgi:uncharacterized integral membrane protein
VALVVVGLFGAALVAFTVQNTRSVQIRFFVTSGHVPEAVALLGAFLIGGLAVLGFWSIRGALHRISRLRAERRQSRLTSSAAPTTSP